MKCFFNTKRYFASRPVSGFSFPEVMAALVILAFVGTNVMVIISRNMASVADLSVRMQAFEVARDNMENLLGSETVSEQVEYGFSEKYPDIEWQTVVESFYEPMTNRLWIQAVCLAEYEDSSGEIQKVEFAHWLTNLTKKQVIAILNKMNAEQQSLEEADQFIPDIEMAAEYADVEPEVIQAWVDGGMPTARQGGYIKGPLELWKEYDGDPPPEALTQWKDDFYDETGVSSFIINGVGGGSGGGNTSGPFRPSGPGVRPGPPNKNIQNPQNVPDSPSGPTPTNPSTLSQKEIWDILMEDIANMGRR